MSKVKVKNFNPRYRALYEPNKDTELIIYIGGRGGGKTYEVSKAVAYKATIQGKRIQVLRDERAHIKESILNEVLLRFDSANKYGHFNGAFERLETGIKNLSTGEMCVFTKGFRASSLTQTGHLKSVSNIDEAVIEEGEDIRSEDKFNTYADSLRKEGSLIHFILNTPDVNHWIIKRYFNLYPVTTEDEPTLDPKLLDGYFKIEAKDVPGVEVVNVNYTDNEFLPDKIVRRYESYGDNESPNYNPHYYLTAIKGYSSSGQKGQIFKDYKVITIDEFSAIDAREIIGQDFGTSSPAATVNVKIVNNNLYIHELNYKPMDIKALAIKYCELGLTRDNLIIADSAEPDSIERLYFGLEVYGMCTEEELEIYPQLADGWDIVPSKKGAGSIKAGISSMLAMNIHITEGSKNVLHEFVNYVWATDRNENPLDMPIDNHNHAIDAVRMVVLMNGTY